MTWLDYFVIIVVGTSVAFGAMKGLIRGLFSIAFALVGFIGAAFLYSYPAKIFELFTSTSTADLLGFIAIFLGALIAGAFASRAILRGLKRAKLGWVDHALGAAFGLARGWLFCSTLYLILTAFPLTPTAVHRSEFRPFLIEGTHALSYLTSADLRKRFLVGYHLLTQSSRRLQRKGIEYPDDPRGVRETGPVSKRAWTLAGLFRPQLLMA